MKDKVVCLYHKKCSDGAASAWVVKHKFPNAILIPIDYGDPIPNDIDHSDLYIVDFSLTSAAWYEEAVSRVRRLTVIDHHATAAQALADYLKLRPVTPTKPLGEYFMCDFGDFRLSFDLNHSGAVLTWKFLYPETPTPRFLLMVEDRDLNRYKFYGVRELHQYVSGRNYQIEAYDCLLDPESLQEVVIDNREGVEKWESEVMRYANFSTTLTLQDLEVAGYKLKVRVIGLPNKEWFTDVTSRMCDNSMMAPDGVAIAFTPTDQDGATTYRVTSRNPNVNAGLIAKAFGGGGHPGAAGFKIPTGSHRVGILETLTG